MNHQRVSWDDYFLEIAKVVASRATCPRKRVGAVIVSANRHILATGYNGSTPGASHCDDVGCLMEEGHCVRTVHAEANAIAQAVNNGVSVRDATIYTTASPCWLCFKLLVNSGIKRMRFGEFYRRDDRIFNAAGQAGVSIAFLGYIENTQFTCPKCGSHTYGSSDESGPEHAKSDCHYCKGKGTIDGSNGSKCVCTHRVELMTGHCHGSVHAHGPQFAAVNCGFSWNRKDDAKYFTGTGEFRPASEVGCA